MLAIAAILGFAADLWPRNSASDAVNVTLVCIGVMATIRIILDCTPGRRRLRYERALHLQEVWRSQWEKEYQAQNK